MVNGYSGELILFAYFGQYAAQHLNKLKPLAMWF
jgi:hypothetical protein